MPATLTLDDIKVARKGVRAPVAGPDDGPCPLNDDAVTDDNSNDDECYDG